MSNVEPFAAALRGVVCGRHGRAQRAPELLVVLAELRDLGSPFETFAVAFPFLTFVGLCTSN